MKETIIWTALPNGRSTTGKLMMSAHVTFHLSYTAQELSQAGGKAKVSNFPTVSAFKPESVVIKVLFNGKPVDAKIVSKVEPGLWAKFFPADGPVTSYDPVKPEYHEVRTYSTFDIYKQIETIHADHIIASFEPSRSFREQKLNANLNLMAPHPDILQNRLRKSQTMKSSSKDSHAQVRAMAEADLTHPPMKIIMESRRTGQPLVNQKISDLMVEAVHFHRPFMPVTGEWALPSKPASDFHDAYSMLCQHPQLMRMVGVVFDIELGSIPAGEGVLSVQVDGMPTGSTKFGGTMCVVSSTAFMAKERSTMKGTSSYTSDLTQGFMRMNAEDVALGAMDLSGAVLQTSGFLDHLSAKGTSILGSASKPIRIGRDTNSGGRPAPIDLNDVGLQKIAAQSTDEDSADLPARRTAGITVYRREHSARHILIDNLGQQIWTSRFADALYADDLHKGWRPDVQHKGKWFSLTARTVFYKIADNVLATDVMDEGHVSPSNASSPDGKVVKIPESVMTWEGWSLSAPKPVSPLVDRSLQDDTVPNTSQISSIAEARAHKYSPAETDPHYRLNYFAEPTKGSLPTLRFGETYAIRSRSVDLAGNSLPLTAKEPNGASQSITYLRHEPILPPSVHLHDSAQAGESAYVLAVRKTADGRTGPKAMRFLYPPVGGMNMAELHGKFDQATGAPDPAFWDKVLAIDNRKDLPESISSVNAPPVPYLTDPASVGAALKREGRAAKPTDLATTGFLTNNSWIDAQASMISLMPGATFKMDSATGTQGIGLTLAPGQDVTLSLSSTTTEEYLPVFEQTRWIERALESKGDSLTRIVRNPKFNQRMEAVKAHRPFHLEMTTIKPIVIRFNQDAQPESSAQKALDACLKGQNKALTPSRNVRVVYAVQVPEPGFKFEKVEVSREAGTSASFDLQGRVHGWSTEELEVTLSYADPVDDISEHRRTTSSANHDAKVFDQHPYYVDTVPVNGWYATEDIEFHDTKCHIVNVIAVAKTRYADFFPNAASGKSASTRLRTTQGSAASKLLVTDGEVGTYTKTYIKENIIVPSCKRPDKPEVEYVLPTLGWASENTPSGRVSRKRGNTVRVLLRRPWFSSGIGEKLGIVLADGSTASSNDPDYYYHSTIGFDPAFEYLDAPLKLTSNNFVGHSGVATGIPIAEIGGTATIVAYDAHFDNELQLWYVDVEIDPLTAYYTPFLRLVLCRYQQNSTPGNFVSSLAVTEITQLQPDRIALVQTVQQNKLYNVYYAGMPGKTTKSLNIVIGTLETQSGVGPEAPWMPVMKENDPFEFIVPFSNGPFGLMGAVSNLYEWGSAAENIKKLADGTPGRVQLPSSSGEYRVVLREYEVHPSIEGDPPVAVNNSTIAGRLVHVDVISLNSKGSNTLGGRPAPP